MSGAAVKASRREIRKAFGDQALSVIETHANSITDLVRAHAHEVKMRVEHIQLARDDAKQGDATLHTKIDTFIDRGFFGRVKWFVTGR